MWFLPAEASGLFLLASVRLFDPPLYVLLAGVVVSAVSLCPLSASFLPLAATR